MFVETRAKLFPESGAQWIEVAGAYAMYDGISSPLTQTFGLGLFEPASTTDMETLERFFQQRGAPVFHEVSPLADKSLLALLNERQYEPLEFTSVMRIPPRHRNVSSAPTRASRCVSYVTSTNYGRRQRQEGGARWGIFLTSCWT